MRHIEGLNYGQLARVLRAHGFQESVDTITWGKAARIFVHPQAGAELVLPVLADSETLRAHHFVAARAMMSDYGLMTRQAFDMELLGAASPEPATV